MDEGEKLKWMYEGKQSSINHEEYLLGKRITTMAEEEESTKGDFLPKQESSVSTGNVTVLEKLDYESKVREDPLFKIRKNELEHRKELLSNPMKKRRIQQLLTKALERDLKVNTSKRNKRRSRDSSSESDSSEDIDKKISKKSLGDKKLRDALKKKLESDLKSRRSYSESDSSEEERRKRRRQKKHRNDQNKLEYDNDRGGKKNERKYDSERSSDRKRSSKWSPSKKERRKSREDEEDSPIREKSPCKSKKHSGYGLIYVKDGMKQEKSHSNKKISRKRRTPTPEPEKPKYVRKEKQGFSRKLTTEELEKRRNEMIQNAEWREDQRKTNVNKFAAEDSREKDREERMQKIREKAGKHGIKPNDFIHDMKLHSASIGSLEDTVRRKKHKLNRKL